MNKKNSKKLIIRNSTAEFLIFTNQEGKNQIEVRYENGTIWLTQKLIAELFSVSVPTNEHLKNIFESNELQKDSVIRKFLITASDGKKSKKQITSKAPEPKDRKIFKFQFLSKRVVKKQKSIKTKEKTQNRNSYI